MRGIPAALFLLLPVAVNGQTTATPAVEFTTHPIASGLRGGYHVAAVDVDADGRTDLIALASGMNELVWFRNPNWERFVIAANRIRMINCAAADIDGDRIPEIILAEGFDNDPAKSPGAVLLLRSQGEPRALWDVKEIDRLPTSHRIRTARTGAAPTDLLFVNAPLAGAQGRPPEYRDPIPVVAYRSPAWQREVIHSGIQGVMHGIVVADWNRDGRDDLLTASFEGIHLFRQSPKGWKVQRLTAGDPAPWPKGGSSDVAVGTMRGRRFLTAIEPWHGDQIAVYLLRGTKAARQVIDQSTPDGHTLLTGDFDGDGNDEIVAGYRRGKAVVLFQVADRKGRSWKRLLVDDTMNAAGCATADFNGDGKLDLACIGSTSADLKWYENRTPR